MLHFLCVDERAGFRHTRFGAAVTTPWLPCMPHQREMPRRHTQNSTTQKEEKRNE